MPNAMPMSPVRLIVERAPLPGARNMAVDETLLESALERDVCTVRIYEWSAPTVSLGYFQNADEYERDSQWSGLAAVRRLSGGGAILHDREITYSVALPLSHVISSQPSRLYGLVHEGIIAVLARSEISATMRGERRGGVASGSSLNSHADSQSLDAGPSTPDPFLCFGRGDPNDIVLGSHKIVGSAQRRRQGAILQHGSILLERSPHAAEFPGIADLTGIALDRFQLGEQVGAAIANVVGSRAERSGLDDSEQRRASELERERYSTLRWAK